MMSPGHDLEQKKATGALANTDAASCAPGGSLGIVLICTNTVLDVVVDDEIQLFFIESEMAGQQSINVVN